MVRSCPATWDFTWTMAEASTVPTTRSSVGTDSCVAGAAETGTIGMPIAAAFCVWTFVHPVSARSHTAEIDIRTQRGEMGTKCSCEERLSLFLRSVSESAADGEGIWGKRSCEGMDGCEK